MSKAGLQSVYMSRRPLLERIVRARTNSAEEAAEVMQELWIRIEQLRSGPIRDPAAYLMRTAMNLVIDRAISVQRSQQREAAYILTQPASAEFPDQEAKVVASDELDRVQRQLGEMPPAMSRALLMFRVEGRSQKDIAAELGMSVSGVEKLLSKAFRQLVELQRSSAPERVHSPETLDVRRKPDAR